MNEASPAHKPSSILFGLVQPRVCYLPTWRGWLLILAFAAWLGGFTFRHLYPFLASNQPVPSDILVVEGWAPPCALQEAKAIFDRGHYKSLLVTGGPIEEGSLWSDFKTYADLGSKGLLRLGFPPDHLQTIPGPWVMKDRTYSSACALRGWMESHGGVPPAFNVVSVGTHCRRTHLLFSKAFGAQSQVGILSVVNCDFNPSQWWKSSQGVRSVLDETIAYLYAKFLFRPAPERRGDSPVSLAHD